MKLCSAGSEETSSVVDEGAQIHVAYYSLDVLTYANYVSKPLEEEGRGKVKGVNLDKN
jgi:hypothetical protein